MALQEDYPWTKKPLIVNAPMGGFPLQDLACTVSEAGGLGLLSSINDMGALDQDLAKAKERLSSANLSVKASGTLPIGVGFLTFVCDLEAAATVIEKYRPAVVWLFVEKKPGDYQRWNERMRKLRRAER